MDLNNKKKAQIPSVLTFFMILFAVTVTVILGKTVLNEVYGALNNESMMTATANITRNTMNDNFLVFDYAIPLLAVVMIIGLMITSFLIPTHPIFLVINIVGIFVLVFLGMVMTNVYGEIVSGEGATFFGTVADDYPTTNQLMQYLPYWGAIAIALASIIMFARGQT